MKEEALKRLRDVVKANHLKYTRQREMVFETIYDSDEHLSAEEIYNSIKKHYPDSSIGIATVYKSVTFLEESNLITSISLAKESKKYEANLKKHHDHLICTSCNKIAEFLDESIEKRQDEVAKKFGFKLIDHTMYLYGLCKDCQNIKQSEQAN